MSKRTKREKLPTRRRLALKRILIAAAALFFVNHVMLIGLLLPIQAIRQGEELNGVRHGSVVKRVWDPEIKKTFLSYLTETADSVTLASANWTLYGWVSAFSLSLDCTTGAPLYAGERGMSSDSGSAHYYFGRIDDPEIETVAISFRYETLDQETGRPVWREGLRREIPREDWLEHRGRQYFLLRTALTEEWPLAEEHPHAFAVGLDRTGRTVADFQIDQGEYASYS